MDKAINKNNKAVEAAREHLESLNTLYDQIKNKIIKEILEKIYKERWTSLKILDVGIGGGFWIDFFLKKGADVTGVDMDNLFIEGDKERYPKAKFFLSDATTMKINNKFDLVFAKDVIEHIEDDEKFLSNMNTHLKEEGLIMINTQNSWSLNYLIQGGYHFLRGDKNWKGWDPTHVRFYQRKSLGNKLKKAGFEPIKWFGSYYFPYRMLADKLKINEKFLIPFCFLETIGLYNVFPFNILGWNIGVVAKKNG